MAWVRPGSSECGLLAWALEMIGVGSHLNSWQVEIQRSDPLSVEEVWREDLSCHQGRGSVVPSQPFEQCGPWARALETPC